MDRTRKSFDISKTELQKTYDTKYPVTKKLGWGPVLRRQFGYITPDEYYETAVDKLVFDSANWADIGCGRDIFPSNHALEKQLVARAGRILGVDPDANIEENPYITEAFRGFVDDYEGADCYDIVTMRMVAEHVEQPPNAVSGIHRMLSPGGRVVIYTPHKWAPLSVLARWTPLWFHHLSKRLFWGTEDKDTFPVQDKMNTKKTLITLFENEGMNCIYYELLPDCRVFSRFRWLNRIELMTWRVCQSIRIPYPECCILAVFVKN